MTGLLEDLQIDGEVERVACDEQGRLVVETLRRSMAQPATMSICSKSRMAMCDINPQTTC